MAERYLIDAVWETVSQAASSCGLVLHEHLWGRPWGDIYRPDYTTVNDAWVCGLKIHSGFIKLSQQSGGSVYDVPLDDPHFAQSIVVVLCKFTSGRLLEAATIADRK